MKLAIKVLTKEIEYWQHLIKTGNFWTLGKILDIKEYEKQSRKKIAKLRKAIKILKEWRGKDEKRISRRPE